MSCAMINAATTATVADAATTPQKTGDCNRVPKPAVMPPQLKKDMAPARPVWAAICTGLASATSSIGTS